MYGSHPANRYFYNKYWYNWPSLEISDWASKDYRRYTIHEAELNYYFHFRMRKESPETFESR